MAVYDEHTHGVPLTAKAGQVMNYAGAVVSLGLMVGIGVWGYQLVMRDVTGIPVVRAMEGPMRTAPDNPGGEIAQHTGLSINALVAEGEAAPPEDRLVLAPATTDLSQEDLDVQPTAEAGEVQPIIQSTNELAAAPVSLTDDTSNTPDKPMTADDILAMADQIASGAAPLTDLAEGVDVAPVLAVDGESINSAPVSIIARTVPGVVTSLRPPVRPAYAASDEDAVAAALASATAVTATPNATINTENLPVGTKLVQLGAYPTAESAASAWTKLSGRFGSYLSDKEQVIQEASSGGQAFYRLRAKGFNDLSEARRLCAALAASGADCIPVVTR